MTGETRPATAGGVACDVYEFRIAGTIGPQPPDDGARAVGQLRKLPRHADPQDRLHDLPASRRGCGPPEQGRQVHGVPSGDEPTSEIDDARMHAGNLMEHENRRPRTTPEDLVRAPVVCEVELLELRADLLAEAHTDCFHPWFAQHGRTRARRCSGRGRSVLATWWRVGSEWPFPLSLELWVSHWIQRQEVQRRAP